MKNNKTFTVITGASKGLGRCLAIECAIRGRNLILISLPNENIDQLAIQLSEKYNIQAQAYETDLTEEHNILNLTKEITQHYQIDMLINNAGIGGTNYFENASIQYINTIIQLNMRALVLLSHELLPMLKKQKKAYILNIASLAAFGPMPYKTIYPASKAFVASFSKGLNTELMDTSVSVSVAYPGGMATNPTITSRIEKHNAILKASFLTPRATAKICINKTFARKTNIVPGWGNKLNSFLIRFAPESLLLQITSLSLRKELQTTST